MKSWIIAIVGSLIVTCGALAQGHHNHGHHGGNWYGGNSRAGGGNHWNTNHRWNAGRTWTGNRYWRNGYWYGVGGVGWHSRYWWVNRGYTVILIDGCWYYLDNGVCYPAYGYDPNCVYYRY